MMMINYSLGVGTSTVTKSCWHKYSHKETVGTSTVMGGLCVGTSTVMKSCWHKDAESVGTTTGSQKWRFVGTSTRSHSSCLMVSLIFLRMLSKEALPTRGHTKIWTEFPVRGCWPWPARPSSWWCRPAWDCRDWRQRSMPIGLRALFVRGKHQKNANEWLFYKENIFMLQFPSLFRFSVKLGIDLNQEYSLLKSGCWCTSPRNVPVHFS